MSFSCVDAVLNFPYHYNDVIMGAMAYQITSLAIVYSTVHSGAGQRKHQSSASLAFFCGEFPAQRASNAENVSIWWRHHDLPNRGFRAAANTNTHAYKQTHTLFKYAVRYFSSRMIYTDYRVCLFSKFEKLIIVALKQTRGRVVVWRS